MRYRCLRSSSAEASASREFGQASMTQGSAFCTQSTPPYTNCSKWNEPLSRTFSHKFPLRVPI